MPAKRPHSLKPVSEILPWAYNAGQLSFITHKWLASCAQNAYIIYVIKITVRQVAVGPRARLFFGFMTITLGLKEAVIQKGDWVHYRALGFVSRHALLKRAEVSYMEMRSYKGMRFRKRECDPIKEMRSIKRKCDPLKEMRYRGEFKRANKGGI